MKNYPICYLFITLSIIVNSCTEGFKEEYSKLFIVLTEVTAITTPTNDTTPDYTFSSTLSGALTYGGSCSSSTTIATTGNNTITLNTLSVGTYADCTITVTKTIANENSEKKLKGSLTITSFTVTSSYIPSWQLIAKQVDLETFSSGAVSTFLENENDNSSSTFMSIGNLIPSNYVTDGKYKFKLVWDGLEMASEDIKEVIWTQTSWLESSTTQGFQEIGVSGFNTSDSANTDFVGLALSTSSQCVIDGDGGTVSDKWFNCVGLIDLWYDALPGPLRKKASSMHLYIWATESSSQMGGSIQGVEPDLSTAVTTLAGSSSGFADATGTSAQFDYPKAITTDGTNLYVADPSNHRIRKIVISTGVVTTLAGQSDNGSTDATGTSASFYTPRGITTDGTNLYVADQYNHRIRKIVISTGVVTTLAGSSQGSTDATGTSASFYRPVAITTDGTNLYVADYNNHRIRKIVISTGVVTTLAGSSPGFADATGTSASFNYPRAITTDGTNLYVADRNNNRIRKIVITTGVVTTLAGGSSQESTDATGTSARFYYPRGITTDGTNLYVVDTNNHRIRKIVISTGVVTTLAGSTRGFTDATGTSARFDFPRGITTDGTNLYVADSHNHRIRKIE